MKKLWINLSLTLALNTLYLLPVLAMPPIVIGLNKFSKADWTVKNFNGIAAGGPIKVVVTLGNNESLRFEGDQEAISTLIAEVKGNILIIRPQNSWKSWARKYQNKRITAYVSAKAIKSLTMSGSGSIVLNGKLKESNFAATLSGSGSITANVDVKDFNGVISGSGNLNFSGSADRANLTLSGSGSLTKKEFTVGTLSTQISGSGSVYVHAEDQIHAVISGSGSVNYSGNAQVDKTVIGSGRVRKI